MKISETPEGLQLHIGQDNEVFLYPKINHLPATFTVLNFIVENIEKTVDQLVKNGVQFQHYGGDTKTDERGILRGIAAHRGPDIAWFKDPARNFLSIIQEK